MNFGQAIEEMKKGNRVARSGWNGKDMFIFIQDGSIISKEDARNKVLQGLNHDKITINAHIDMKTADGSITIGWLANQSDMLSEDWFVIMIP